MWFASDNAAPAHPAVLAALAAANAGHSASYGADAAMVRVTARLRDLFEAPEAAVYLVSTGTAANALALACLCPPWATIFCHRNAHVEEDECGAPEFYTGGAKLTLLGGADARIDPAGLKRALALTGRGGVHGVQKGVLALTNATEAGTVYTPAAVARLAGMARAQGLPVFMDGARIANALVALDCTPAELTWRAGVDAVAFGGTKNGLIGVEAVILFDPARAWEFELRRKRAGHLISKHRFLSAQIEAYLDGDLWRDLATRANARAAALAHGLGRIPGAALRHPVEANTVFAALPRPALAAAEAAGAKFYPWSFAPELPDPASATETVRLVCNWATTPGEVSAFLALLEGSESHACDSEHTIDLKR